MITMRATRTLGAALTAFTMTALATSCSLVGTGDDDARETSSETSDGTSATPGGGEVVLVTHSSFVLPDDLVADFEEQSGYDLTVRAAGDAGELTNKLVLSQANPQGDVAFGVDNTFASRALDEDVFAPADVAWPDGVEAYAAPGDADRLLTPVDNGNVCVNIDTTWFDEQGIDPPQTLDDLTDPAYEGLLTTPGAATSSPGLAFLLTTIDEYGDDWPAYWEDLVANGAEITSGWTEAYQGSFTQGGGGGKRPIVVSYDSSPAFTVADGSTTTAALLDTCFLQVEYAGVLAGADNPEGGAALVEWMLSAAVQAALPESMYVFPVVEGTELPAEWAEFAQRPTDPHTVDPATIAAERDDWLREWTEVTTR